MRCESGRCRSGARCLPCIERDGLTRRVPPRLAFELPVFDHRLVQLAVAGLEREAEKLRRTVELAKKYGAKGLEVEVLKLRRTVEAAERHIA